jgi:hypothetical protein
VLQGSRLASRAAGQEFERVPLRLGAGIDVFLNYVRFMIYRYPLHRPCSFFLYLIAAST